MPIIGTRRTFHKKWKFVVEIDQFQSAGFQKCSELSVEVANIDYHEGGSLIPTRARAPEVRSIVKRYYGSARRRASNTITI